MTMSAPTAAAPPKPQYKRSVKNYLIDSRFQLKYTGYFVGITLVIGAMLGTVLVSTTGKVFEESRTVGRQGEEVVKKTKAVSAVVQMNIKDQYADNPELDLEAYGAELVAMFEAATRPDHGPAASSVPVSQPATAPHPVDLVTPKEEK